MPASRKRVCTPLMLLAVLACPAIASAYQEAASPAPPSEDVVIRREAIKLTDPQVYRIPLQLSAGKLLELTASADGQVHVVHVKPGQKVAKETEAFRLDDARSTLALRRAKANLQAAKVEKKIAESKKDDDLTALADARLEAAQAEVELAQLDVDRHVIRAPFAGEMLRVHVLEGQYVRAGDPLGVLADVSQLQIEVPIERPKSGQPPPIELKIEETAVKGKIEAVLPLHSRFEPLRELADSIASAVVAIDNADRRFHVGQTVYSPLVPLAPVSAVPTTSVTNQADGTRKVQVLRESIVRNLPVRVMGKVGTDAVFVSGSFLPGDELIVSSSRELPDGTPVRPLAMGGAGAAAKPPASAAKPAPAAAPKTTGF